MKNKKLSKNNKIFLISFLVMLVIGLSIICFSIRRQKQNNLESARLLISSEQDKLQYAIDSRIMKTQIMEMLVMSHHGVIVDFEKNASFLYDEDPALRSVQLAPKGVVTSAYMYPHEENFTPHDLFADPARKADAERARDMDQIILSGPLELRQGGQALIIRNPIFITKEDGQRNFWGFSMIVFNVPEIFSIANLDLLTSQNYYYRLWRYLPDSDRMQVILDNTDRPLNDAIREEIAVPNATWYLDIRPQKGWISFRESFMIIAIVFLAAGIVLSVQWFQLREREASRLSLEKEERQKEALREAYEAATRANQAKSDFLSRMSHDIRTPLNAIIGMTAIAGAHKEDPDRVSDCLAKITASSRHLLGLINDVLDMSRIEAGKITLTEEAFHLGDLMDNLVQIMQPEIQARHHELVIHTANLEHENVMGDSLRIRQAFVNIVGNAIKYTPNGGKIEIEVEELESGSPKIGAYRFVFRDNGIGMSREFAKTIFDPFSREQDSRVNKVQGTGLGMAITKNIIQMMDGNIQVASEPDIGTTFTVTLRLKLQDTDEAHKTPPVETANTLDDLSQIDLSDKHLLLAEDNLLNLEIACEILGMTKIQIDTAENGEVAVQKFRQSEVSYYGMILMDVQMPIMNGYDATMAIRALDRPDAQSIPIIAMTANAFAEDVEKAIASQMNEHLSKPLEIAKLTEVLNRWLRQ